MVDDTEQREELTEAKRLHLFASVAHKEDSDEVQEAARKVDGAQAKLDACYEPLTLTALPPADFEALMAAHPPTKEQRSKDFEWNEETFRPALLAVTVEGDMTEDDWAEMNKSGQITWGEFTALFNACLNVNSRSSDDLLGKG